MAQLLPPAEMQSIRELLGLSATDCPDSVIKRLPFLPAAEAEVKRQVPAYAAMITAAGDDRLHVLSAIVYLTAAKLCARQRNLVREGERIGDYIAGKLDWDALGTDLLAEANGHLRAIPSLQLAVPSSLIVAGVTRTARAQERNERWTGNALDDRGELSREGSPLDEDFDNY